MLSPTGPRQCGGDSNLVDTSHTTMRRGLLLTLTTTMAAMAAGSVCPQSSDRLTRLFTEQLNLTVPALSQVRSLWQQGQQEAACAALVQYYVQGTTGRWWRQPAVQPGTGHAGGEADNETNDNYCFYSVCAHQPRAHGALDWTWLGPDNDIEWLYAINRMPMYPDMVSAWVSTGNPVYLEYFWNVTADWIASQPVPASPPGPNSTWRSLEAGIRMDGSWPVGFFGFLGAPSPPAGSPFESWILDMVSLAADHGQFLSKYSSQGPANWQSMQYAGLANAALGWPELAGASDWYETAAKGILADMNQGIYPDGVETEETAHYHLVAAKSFEGFVNISQIAGFAPPAALAQGVELMLEYVAFSMDPMGYAPLNGDSDLDYNAGASILESNRWRLEKIRESDSPKPDYILQVAPVFGRPDWTYAASQGEQGQRPAGPPTRVWPWGGQVVMRSDWTAGSQWAWFDIGPFGSSGHAHADKLHLSVRAFGVDLLVDSGRFSYDGPVASTFRNAYAIHSRGHNVVLLSAEGCSSSSNGSCVLCGQVESPALAPSALLPGKDFNISDSQDWARGAIQFQGLTGQGVHARGIVHLRGVAWVVADRISTDRPRLARWLWHAHPNTTATLVANPGTPSSVLVQHLEGPRLDIVSARNSSIPAWSNASIISGQLDPEPQGWYSPSYDVFGPSDAVVLDALVPAGNSSVAWVIRAAPTASATPIIATIIDQSDVDITVQVQIGATTTLVVVNI